MFWFIGKRKVFVRDPRSPSSYYNWSKHIERATVLAALFLLPLNTISSDKPSPQINESRSVGPVKNGIGADGKISDFDEGFGPNIQWIRNFGLNIENENAPVITDDEQFIRQGTGALRLRSDEDFSAVEGFAIGSVFRFIPGPVDIKLRNFNSVSYWVRSEEDYTAEGVTAAIQLTMSNGSIWEQFIQTPLTTTYQEVRVAINPNGLRLVEESPCGNIDRENIAEIAFLIIKGSSEGKQLTAYFDEVGFIFDPNIPDVRPRYTGLIDDFLDPAQYNRDHRNDVIIPLFQELAGGFTDDDGTMLIPGSFEPKDLILNPENPDPRGVVTLNWNNADNPEGRPFDLFFSVILEIGADITDNQFFVVRSRGQSGGEQVNFLITDRIGIRRPDPLRNELDEPVTVELTDQFVTYNLPLSSFSDCPFRFQAVKSLTLDFPNNNGSPSSGVIEIDNIGLSPFRHPSTVNLTFPTGLPDVIESGDDLDITIELLDESGQPLTEFPGDIELTFPGGVVAPSTIDEIVLDNSGMLTKTVKVFGDGLLQLTAADPISNASSAPQDINLRGTAEEVTDHFRVTIGENHDSPIDPFLESTFPVTITGFRDAAETTEVDFSNTNQVAIAITSTVGDFRLLDEGEVAEELVLSAPTTTVRGFITNLSEFPNQQSDVSFNLNVSFTSLPAEIKGTGTARLRDGSGPNDELEFLRSQQQDSGLIATNLGGDVAHIYTNALAAIAFTHAGDLERAERIFNALIAVQIPDGDNSGGFQDSYNADGSPRGSETSVSTGANAWVMMALNFYNLTVDETLFQDTAEKLIEFLSNRQILDSTGANFGGVFASSDLDNVFVTEHQGEAYSAFNVYAEMPWLTTAEERQSFRDKAKAVRDFIENKLFIPTLGAFRISADTEENPSIDAQTAPFLALIDVMDFRSAIEVIMDPSNDFLVSQTINNTVPFFEDQRVTGTKFRRNEIVCNSEVFEQLVWVEGSSQVALALEFVTDEMGDPTNPDGITLLNTNIQKMQHPSGGYPTHLGEQFDECPPVPVGDASIGTTTAAWRYFAQVPDPINPYAAVAEAPLTVSVTATRDATEGGTPGIFSVEVDTILNEDLVVDFTTSGSATPGDDYTPLSGSVTISQGQSSSPVVVVASIDELEDEQEMVVIQLLARDEYLIGVPSNAELNILETDIGSLDIDGDGLIGDVETNSGTDPNDWDSDDDGIDDGYEVENGLDPLVNDADEDNDGDELTNLQEYLGDDGEAPLRDVDPDDGATDGVAEPNPNDTGDATPAGNTDSDGDGLSNLDEIQLGTDPNDWDSDDDGIDDGYEVENGLDPLADDAGDDADDDGRTNEEEYLGDDGEAPLRDVDPDDGATNGVAEPNPNDSGDATPAGNGDNDGDGLSNLAELDNGLDPNDWDTDDDGIDDGYEIENGLNPFEDDADQDADGDQRTNLQEYLGDDGEAPLRDVDPTDGATDGVAEPNPDDTGDSTPAGNDDSDGDGLTNIDEVELGTDPNDWDSDDDGIDDGYEVENGLDPLVNDADEDNDGDELTNLQEYLGDDGEAPLRDVDPDDGATDGVAEPNPNDTGDATPAGNTDSDGDGLSNLDEIQLGTDPNDWDSDDDGIDDGYEVENGLDPLADDAGDDADDDGRTNEEEYLGDDGEAPLRDVDPDDGATNGVAEPNPNDSGDATPAGNGDNDGDGLSNLAELDNGLDPNDWDTDDDGIDDGYEIENGLNPFEDDADQDADGDQRTNLQEYLGDDGEAPLRDVDPTDGATDGVAEPNPDDTGDATPAGNDDSDGDGLTNIDEVELGTDPNDWDSDDDGIDDGYEVENGLDPLTDDADDDADGDDRTNEEEYLGDDGEAPLRDVDPDDGATDGVAEPNPNDTGDATPAGNTDSDGDGLSNLDEIQLGTDPNDWDTDDDGIDDGYEVENGLDPLADDAGDDADDDGRTNEEEYLGDDGEAPLRDVDPDDGATNGVAEPNPNDSGDATPAGNGDNDGDGLSNLAELDNGLDPNDWDTDDDGIDDGYEIENGLNPLADDADQDADGDQRTNLQEYLGDDGEAPLRDVDPTDGATDGVAEPNPDDTGDATPAGNDDSDGDGLTNIDEVELGTDPNDWDSDDDGIDDGYEVENGLDPLTDDADDDADGDDRTNEEEYLGDDGEAPLRDVDPDDGATDGVAEPNPNDTGDATPAGNTDSDGDGLSNLDEIQLGTDPNDWDTDDDGIDDGYEVENGLDPLADDAGDDADDDGRTNEEEYLGDDGEAPLRDVDPDDGATNGVAEPNPNDSGDATPAGNGDNDGDGLSNRVELDNGLDPNDWDTDDDGIDDGYEIENGLNPFEDDADQDADGDQRTNLQEYLGDDGEAPLRDVDPTDGATDGVAEPNPDDTGDATPAGNDDSDGDGLTNIDEVELGTDPNDWDSDDDGIDDGYEVENGLDPLTDDADDDADGDDRTNEEEYLGDDGEAPLRDVDPDDGATDGVAEPNPNDTGDATPAGNTDSDGDGLSNLDEIQLGTDPNDWDTDDDGIDDGYEVENGLDPLADDAGDDADDDGRTNEEEYLGDDGEAPLRDVDPDDGATNGVAEPNPNDSGDATPAGNGDNDGDGLSNRVELDNGLDPNDWDTDDDGIDDGYEIENGLNPLEDDADQDADGDQRTNLQEYLGDDGEAPLRDVDPTDGATDGVAEPNPDDTGDATPAGNDDSDGDGLTNIDEVELGTDPNDWDSDDDGIDDGYEVENGLDPLTDDADDDADGDGRTNEEEYLGDDGEAPLRDVDPDDGATDGVAEPNPNDTGDATPAGNTDSDGDGLSNLDEIQLGTDPNDWDTDDDGIDDGYEVENGLDPLADDAGDDADDDGRTNEEEYLGDDGEAPLRDVDPDDGATNGVAEPNPNDSGDATPAGNGDNDGDGLSNRVELDNGLDPNDWDTDDDGIDDGYEIENGLNPFEDDADQDADGDQRTNLQEYLGDDGEAPLRDVDPTDGATDGVAEPNPDDTGDATPAGNDDSDGDGLTNIDEVELGTDPNDWDSDDDGIDDGYEVENGLDPLTDDADDDADGDDRTNEEEYLGDDGEAPLRDVDPDDGATDGVAEPNPNDTGDATPAGNTDSDGDGLSNLDEIQLGTDPNDWDTDDDGIDDGYEVENGLDPLADDAGDDADDDGRTNEEEYLGDDGEAPLRDVDPDDGATNGVAEPNPNDSGDATPAGNGDNDGDGLSNRVELDNGLDPNDWDTDDDGIDDGYEIENGLNPFEDDADQDADGDQRTNLQEYLGDDGEAPLRDVDPTDGATDGVAEPNPDDTGDATPAGNDDSDGDGLTNIDEVELGTDPNDWDSDDDGIDDGYEVENGLDPLTDDADDDADGDDRTNEEEYLGDDGEAPLRDVDPDDGATDGVAEPNPNDTGDATPAGNTDSDGDGLSNLDEIQLGTDPNDWDTDDDGIDDGYEVENGLDPLADDAGDDADDDGRTNEEEYLGDDGEAPLRDVDPDDGATNGVAEPNPNDSGDATPAGNGDNDGDGLSNRVELDNGLDPNDWDTDDDGIDDGYEIENGLNPFEDDADQDADGDQRTNLQEYLGDDGEAPLRDVDPTDGATDGVAEPNPDDTGDATPAGNDDSDGDGLTNIDEVELGTDPNDWDSDDDGIDDGYEVENGLDPLTDDADDDADGDGRTNEEEYLGDDGEAPLRDVDPDDGATDGVAEPNPNDTGDATPAGNTDSDGDGLSNLDEIQLGTDPNDWDTDDDGIDDGYEVENGLDPLADDAGDDADDDGRTNEEEYLGDDGEAPLRDVDPDDGATNGVAEPNPNDSGDATPAGNGDNDGDGLSNRVELDNGLDPNDWDTDDDGIDDGYEIENGLNPLEDDADQDADGDQRTNLQEYLGDDGEAPLRDVDPTDGATDGVAEPNPDDTGDATPAGNDDSDGDGLTNIDEVELGTDPNDWDSDDDGIDDGYEVENGLDPLTDDADDDADGDGRTNEEEYLGDDGEAPLRDVDPDDGATDGVAEPNPNDTGDATPAGNTDSDGDGLSNLDEIQLGTDPNDWDTDDDGIDDGYEVENGLDPLANDAGDDADGDGRTNQEEYLGDDGEAPLRDVDPDDGATNGVAEPNPNDSGDATPAGIADIDGDGVLDNLDVDTDNDGIRNDVEGTGDTDGDGVLDFRDLDSDNDGINDVIEAGGIDDDGDGLHDGTDENGNGLVDSVDPDDEDGIPLSPPNSDGDDTPDYLDLDSDNDTVSDLVEGGSGGTDANSDGVVDGPDADGDGIQDSVDDNDTVFGEDNDMGPVNTDSIDEPDYLALDRDNNGINDINEAGNDDLDGDGDGRVDDLSDTDGDGVPDVVDLDDEVFGGIPNPSSDPDNDGIPNDIEGNGRVDTDDDGSPDSMDLDSDNDGILDEVEGFEDTDDDGVPDFRDLDSDNDGINDVIEAGGMDDDGDGQQDGTDENGNGLVDSVDPSEDGVPLAPPNSDGDDTPDYLDLDSDNDTVGDLVEGGSGGTDANSDGVVDGPDADGDGIQDSVDDNDAMFGEDNDMGPVNTDGVDEPDYLDLDRDNNDTNDIDEAGDGGLDGDGDGEVDDPNDSDGDGIPDVVDLDDDDFGGIVDPTSDIDGDNIVDSIDADIDNDGIPNDIEGLGDTDGDGTPDVRDLDSDNDGINDVIEAGGMDDDGDGLQDANDDGTDDENGDGLVDSVDPGEGGTPLEVRDSDDDGAPNHIDLDSDNDTVSDLVESGSGGTDANADGVVDGPDADGDGIQDSVDDNDAVFGEDNDMGPVNTDGVDEPDYLDLDRDNDGTNDIDEAGNPQLDDDIDGVVDDPSDVDGDGIPDVIDNDDGFGGISDTAGVLIVRPVVGTDLAVIVDEALNFQSGLLEQILVVENLSTEESIAGFTVIFRNLPANVSVYNATGVDDNGNFVINFGDRLEASESLEFLVEYFSPFLDPDFTPSITVVAADPIEPPEPTGSMIEPNLVLTRGDGSNLVEFNTVPGRTYTVQYTDEEGTGEENDMRNWTTVAPPINAVANRVHWIDSGPPKTDSHPRDVDRSYRIFEE